jgi:hypothetical protein
MESQPVNHQSSRTSNKNLIFMLVIDIVMKVIISVLSIIHLLNLRFLPDSLFCVIFLLLFSGVINLVYDLRCLKAAKNNSVAKSRLMVIHQELSNATLIIAALNLLVRLLAIVF